MKKLSKIKLTPKLASDDLILIKGGNVVITPDDGGVSAMGAPGAPGASCSCACCGGCDALNMQGQGQKNSAGIATTKPPGLPGAQ